MFLIFTIGVIIVHNMRIELPPKFLVLIFVFLLKICKLFNILSILKQVMTNI